MERFGYFLKVSVTVAVLLAATELLPYSVLAAPRAATSPTLGAAATYSVLAGSIVTNAGNSVISGDVGVSPSVGVPPHVTGFPPGIVNLPGAIHDADAHAALAQAANTAAFTTLDQTCDVTYAGVQDLTLVSPLGPGVYCATAFILTGNLTLTGSGVWIFKAGSTISTSPGSSVTGGDPCNVWWRVVSSASLDTTTSFIGNILALTSISLNTSASLNGRALAQTGAVTLNNNAVSGPICAQVAPTATPTATPTTMPTATPTTTPGPTPPEVPEASSFLLMASGLGGLATWLGWQRMRRGKTGK